MKKIKQGLFFYLLYPLITGISLLPFKILYTISDFLFFLNFYLIRFRKKVVEKNLSIAFPEKSARERKQILRKFYRHFSDILLETIKTFTISRKKLNKRFYLENPEILNDFFSQGKSVIVYGGHQGNWEWIFGVGNQLKHKSMAIYKKLSNPYIDKWVLQTRSKFNFDLIPTYLAKKYIDTKEKKGEKIAYGFLGDQNPLPHKAELWLEFFGKKIPVQTGAETLAKKYDLPVVFLEIIKIKRGYYTGKLSLITDKPRQTGDFEITREYFKRLENSIRKQPEFYYWIHRRFKHAKK